MNIKSQKGFTMQDLVIAIVIIGLLTGILGTVMVAVYRVNLKAKITANATNYIIQIMEDIDKTSYDNVTEDLVTSYAEKFSIPSRYNISLKVENYNENNDKEDLIKKVELTISYHIESDVEEKIVINKLKIKEINS